jgi:hypothetical protein
VTKSAEVRGGDGDGVGVEILGGETLEGVVLDGGVNCERTAERVWVVGWPEPQAARSAAEPMTAKAVPRRRPRGHLRPTIEFRTTDGVSHPFGSHRGSNLKFGTLAADLGGFGSPHWCGDSRGAWCVARNGGGEKEEQ